LTTKFHCSSEVPHSTLSPADFPVVDHGYGILETTNPDSSEKMISSMKLTVTEARVQTVIAK
jgi:hypothetical protein